MRIGVSIAYFDAAGVRLDGAGVREKAALVEAAGFDGIWANDHLAVSGGAYSQPDALMYLAVAASATSPAIELGTNIFCLPLRNPFDMSQRLVALEAMFPGRFTIGVGTGSQAIEYEASGLDWDDRFRRLHDHLRIIREQAAPAAPGEDATWAQAVGRPRLVLGAWHSQAQLRRAATEFDGWMGSASRGSRRVGWRTALTDAIKRYRDLGGNRAFVSTVSTDLRAPAQDIPDDGAFSLRCPPEMAAERLHFLADLGYDDVLLSLGGGAPTGPHSSTEYPYTEEYLAEIRALLPRDGS